MKALILNSGMGSRMGFLTSEHPKCMTEISPRETILSRQLRQLSEVGIDEVVITTGCFESVLVNYCNNLNLPIHITFVNNPLYYETNYIYSIYCAREYLDDDIILMHGDLVFENEVLDKVMDFDGSCMTVSSTLELPEKDFKAVISDGNVVKVGIEFFNDAMAAQPLYKLSKKDWRTWLDKIIEYCVNGFQNCYAENALNEVAFELNIKLLDVKDDLCGEVDNPEDLAVISSKLREIETRDVYMCFATDIIHSGHIRIIKKARRLGRLTIGILSDEAISGYRRATILPASDRKDMFENIVGVYRVVDQNTLSYKDNLEKYQPNIVVHGDDWINGFQKPIRQEVLEILASYGGRLIEYQYSDEEKYKKIDNKVEKSIFSNQRIIEATESYSEIDGFILKNKLKNILLVHDDSLRFLKIKDYFDELGVRLGIRVTEFCDFHPNPDYESAVEGVYVYHQNNCDGIIAVGGGSAIDTAKCIKLFSNMDVSQNYLDQKIIPNEIHLMAIPTTAGTGSESTRYAVLYYKGEKQSINNLSCIPEIVIMDSTTIETLPMYQKKSTMMDALSHAIESFWSVNSTEKSREYSRKAIREIIKNKDGYLKNEPSANLAMLYAANTAGKAINITQTTGGHAMCYKLTSLFGIAHGHAAALCNRILFPYMVEHLDKTVDERGKGYLKDIFLHIADAMGFKTISEATDYLCNLVEELKLSIPMATEEQYAILKNSVNPIRLNNNPVELTLNDIDMLYHEILSKQ